MKNSLFRLVFVAAGLLACSALAADTRPKLVMLVNEPEYDTAKSLPEFATAQLAKDFRVVIVNGSPAPNDNAFTSTDEVASADVLLISVRRRTPPKAQLDAIRKHIMAGKPVVGIRTASHAFVLAAKNQKLSEGGADWPTWDHDVIGGNYSNHHARGSGTTTVTLSSGAPADHPILRGVKLPFNTESTLYKNTPLQPGAQALLTGAIPNQPPEPLAWTFKRPDGGRTFYISLGSPADFKNPEFTKLLRNGLLWAAGK